MVPTFEQQWSVPLKRPKAPSGAVAVAAAEEDEYGTPTLNIAE